MPLTRHFRLSFEARKKIKRLMRSFYHRLLAERVPDRLLATVMQRGPDLRDPSDRRPWPNRLD